MMWTVGCALLLIALFVGWRVRFWLAEGRKMQESGHLAPAPSLAARLFWSILTHLIGYLMIGPIKVVGRHNLRRRGRLIFGPNHQFPLDFDLVAIATRRSFRYMTKTSELKGLRGPFGAWTGAIPVNTKVPGGGEAALNASIEALIEGRNNCFLIFPQGKLLDTIERQDFRTGFARLAQATYEETDGECCFVYPMALIYLRDPRHKTLSHYVFGRLRRLFGPQNYGAIVIIGEGIPAQDLPADPERATDILCQRIQELHAQGVNMTKPRGLVTT